MEVHSGGSGLNLGGPKPRLILASLLLAGRSVVTVDRLIANAWGEQPPPSAVNALQTYVSRLRAALGGDILARRPAGYLLDIAPGQVDAHRFEQALDRGRRLLAAGDGAAALEVLAAAQALWRGGVLSDLAEAPFAQGEILRLSELRLVAAETHAEALLAAGRTAEAVAAAQALVAEHPLRERARAHLMLALYRDGRTTEALDAYREARRLLNEEFGIDPGTQLTALEGAILRQDPALTPAHPAAAGPAHQPSPSAVQAPATTAVTGHAGQAGRVDLPADRFIGRQRETAWIHHALTEHRLLTLTGPGGSGKTRLARHACHDRGLPVHVAELAELTDATLLEATLAQAFGLAVLADLTTVAAALGDGPVLLLLDNCEHLTHELAPVVARLLADVPGLRIVATSRSPLGVAGERLLPVEPLGLAEAAELFGDRAAALSPHWQPSAEELATVRAICASVDGLPLAVELAAGQTVVLSPAQILAGLDRLEAGSLRRDLPDRHRTMRNTIDVSHRLLDDGQRDLFGRLSVFAGTFDLDAAAAVAGTGSGVILPALTGLITGSMLATVPDTSPRRYRMLQTLRQYAERGLSETDRVDLHRRHLRWISPLAAEADRGLRGPDAPHWLAVLRSAQADVRAALGHALSGADPHAGLRLAADASWFWYQRGHIAEGHRWLLGALDAAAGAAAEDRARALTGLACLRYLIGDFGGAGQAITTAVELATAGGSAATLARAHAYHTYYLALVGRGEDAAAAARDAVARSRDTGLDWLLAEALIIAGFVARLCGDSAAAASTLDESVEVGDRCGFAWAASSGLWNRAGLAVDLGDLDTAERAVRRAVRELDRHDDLTGWLTCLNLLAGILSMTGRGYDGAVLLGAVRALGGRVGYDPLRMDPLNGERTVAAVAASVTAADHAAALRQGAGLSRAEVSAFVTATDGAAPHRS
ncbi:AfsR/SARP family transcriptional regulator [Catellatospora bangladeshensis]|uniref:AfsR/SARP family transcriptional regulator n=1 Tax=Catellatospora bangladeshensis TaxID=310355 RepID=UPI00194574E6|nr:BTAD domain-containing putative transcriptional regulator [Catellatospora bangladeshensis]